MSKVGDQIDHPEYGHGVITMIFADNSALARFGTDERLIPVEFFVSTKNQERNKQQ